MNNTKPYLKYHNTTKHKYNINLTIGYGKDLLLFESSTIFLNIHWFCDKLNLSGSNIQLLNGILLISTFFSVRICYGTFVIYQAIVDLQRSEIDFRLRWFYSIAGCALTILNYWWFYVMVKSVKSRFKKNVKSD
jgi:TLC domain